MKTNKTKNEIYEIKKWEEKIKRKNIEIWNKKYTYDFPQYEAIRFFDESIYTRKARVVGAEKDQRNLLENLVEFNNKLRPK